MPIIKASGEEVRIIIIIFIKFITCFSTGIRKGNCRYSNRHCQLPPFFSPFYSFPAKTENITINFSNSTGNRMQFGYEVLTFPVAEFAQIFGPLIYAIHQAWPVQVFGMGSQDELVELSFTKEGTAPTIQQKNVSGIPCAELRDLYFCVKFPDPLAADCMFRLLDAVEKKSAAVALEWEYADFLEQQRLARIDRTLSYCYVSLEEEESADPVGWLSGLTLQQKCELWRMFLGKRLFLPEFEWLRDAMLQGAVPNWIEWHLALYRVLEEENIRFFCKDGQFELLDKEGHRIYFGVDHSEAAEQVLMKVLFPLNQ